MEPTPRKRVKESGTRRKSKPSGSKSLRESPTSPPRNRGKGERRKEKGQEEEYWPLNTPAILREEQRANGLYYLLNWADDPRTGEKYEPSWQRAKNATKAAVEEWEQLKAEQAQAYGTAPSLQNTQESQDSQPIRPAKRKREIPGTDSPLQGASEAKKPRRAGTKETARFQSAPLGTVDSEVLPREIQDTYEEEPLSLHDRGGLDLRVEIPVPEGFDREAYLRAVASSQSTQVQETQTSSQFSGVQTPAASNRFSTVIWDEDIESVVPDSEEQPGSSSYKPSDTQTTRTSVLTRLDSEAVTQGVSDIATDSAALPSSPGLSSTVRSYLAEPVAFLAEESYTDTPGDESQPVSSIQGPQTTQLGDSSWKESQESQSQEIELPSRQVEEVIQLEDSVTWTQFRSQNSHSLTQSHSSSSDSQSQASEQFLTQIVRSLSRAPKSSLPNFDSLLESRQNSQHSAATRSIQAQIDVEAHQGSDSATLAQESQLRQSSPVTEATVSSCEAALEASPVISATPRPAQVSAVYQIATDFPPTLAAAFQTISPQEETDPAEQNPVRTVVTSQEARSQTAEQTNQSKSSEAHRSQSSHLPSPPVENIILSIEQAVTSSSPPQSRQDTPSSSDAISENNSWPNRPTSSQAVSNSSPNRPQSSASNMDAGIVKEGGRFDAKLAIKQRMEAKRAEINARQAARANTTPIPSAAAPMRQSAPTLSHNLPSQVTVQDRTTTTEAPHPSVQSSSDVEQAPASLGIVPTEDNELLVPLSMVAHSRDLYMQIMHEYKALFSKEEEVFDEGLVKNIDAMIDRLKKHCDHMDLCEDDFSTQRQLSEHLQARYAENISIKCLFLAELLPRVRSVDLHILILVRPGRMMEILEALLKYHGLAYARADQNSWNGDVVQGSLRITLHPTGSQKFSTEPPSAVIAFDSTSRELPFLKEIRSNSKGYTSGFAPLISLVINHSIEHLERCFGHDIESIERKIRLVNYLADMGDYAGILPPEYPGAPTAAIAVAEYLSNGALTESWPLPAMPEIEGLDELANLDEDSQTNQNEEIDGDLAAQSQKQILHPGPKRQLANENAANTGSPKRQRFTPVPGELAADPDVFHVSDTVLQTSSAIPQLSDIYTSSKSGAQGEDADQVSLLLKKIKDLEINLRSKESSEAQLRQINKELKARCQDYESSIATIQPKYQEALNDRGNFEYENNQAMFREAETQKRIDAKDAEISKLKEQNAAMTLELSTASKALATSAIPEVAEMANMKEEVSKVKTENERLQKRLANMHNDLEYMRTNYQNSSSLAAESASKLRDLKSKNTELRAEADSNAVRIHEIQRDEEMAAHLATIKRLKAEKEDLEREFEKRGDELKALLNGRRATRGTSVPRSPRMGAGTGTMSPGPAGRSMGRVMQMGSRGNSPAPGEMRNFGEALFQGEGVGVVGPRGVVRWGTHLQ